MSTPIHVLVVADDPADAALVVEHLRRDDYLPMAQRVEDEAGLRAALTECPWDIVIAGDWLPRFGALEALGVLRGLSLALPFLVVSRSPREEAAVAAMKAGAHDYLGQDGLVRLGVIVAREMRHRANGREGSQHGRDISVAQDLSARRQAEQALREERDCLRQVLDSMPAFVGLYDVEGRLIETNRTALEAVGLTREDVLGRVFWAAPWCPDANVQEDIRAAVARSARGEVVRIDVVAHLDGGRVLVVDLVLAPLVGPDGQVQSIVGFGMDITERREAEERARRNADLLRAIVNSAPVALYALDRQGIVRLSEGRVVERLGFHAGQLVGASAFDLYGDLPGFHEAFRQALAGRFAMNAVTAGDMALETAWAPSYDVRGDIDGVIGVTFDVSERAAAERAQSESEHRFSRAFHDNPIGMGIRRLSDDVVIEVNASLAAMLGRPREAIVGRPVGHLGLYADEGARDRVLACAARREPVQDLETKLRDASGRIRDVLMTISYFSMGGAECSLATFVDVTERRQGEAIVRASLREKDTLLREIHHRVKNNLQVIGGLLHFQSKRLGTEAGTATFEELRQRIFAMTLVHERLYRAHDVARVDMGEYVRALVGDLARSVSPGRSIRVDVEADDVRLPVELALPSGMILCELVTNVLKYAFPDAVHGSATVTVRSAGDQVLLGVEDDGIGFPEGFDASVGTSFGWELIRALVLQLDGTVDVRSDRGAAVRIAFAVPERVAGKA